MKTFKRIIVLVCLPCLIYTQASAWKPINKVTTGGGQGGSGSNAPIDGGIVILLVGGLLFGAKKIYDKNKKTKKDLTTV
jgi:hypothetical protein